MTKKDLERRNEFLLLQLKIINNLLDDTVGLSDSEVYKRIGSAAYHSSSEAIKEKLKHIEEYDEEFNFYNKTMDIKDYK